MASYSSLLHGDYVGSMNSKQDVSLKLYSWLPIDSESSYGYLFHVSMAMDRTNHSALVCTFNLLGSVLPGHNYLDLDACTRISYFNHAHAKVLMSFRVRYMRSTN